MISSTTFLFAILIAVCWATYALIARVWVVKSDYPLAFAVWVNLFAALFALPVWISEEGTFRGVTLVVLLVTFLSTACSGVFEGLQIFVRKKLEASRSTALSQLAPLVTFLGAVLILGERLTVIKSLGTVLVVGGNFVAAYRHGGALNQRAVLFALGAALALGGVYIADKFASPQYPIGFYMFLSYFLPAFYIFLFAMPRGKVYQLTSTLRQTTWKLPVLAFTGILGYYLLLKTFRLAEASSIVPIAYSSTILTVLGGIIILRERNNIPQKLAGSLLVFIGVLFLKP